MIHIDHNDAFSNLFKGTSKVRAVDSLVKSGEEHGDLTIIFREKNYADF